MPSQKDNCCHNCHFEDMPEIWRSFLIFVCHDNIRFSKILHFYFRVRSMDTGNDFQYRDHIPLFSVSMKLQYLYCLKFRQKFLSEHSMLTISFRNTSCSVTSTLRSPLYKVLYFRKPYFHLSFLFYRTFCPIYTVSLYSAILYFRFILYLFFESV